MINFHLSLRNPWYCEDFQNLFCRSGMITKHKAWEFEITKYSYTLAEVSFNWKIRTDHAGPELVIGLFGYSVTFKIYDTRHWNWKANDWEVYGNE